MCIGKISDGSDEILRSISASESELMFIETCKGRTRVELRSPDVSRGRAARMRALKDHDPETVARQILDIYSEMCTEDQ